MANFIIWLETTTVGSLNDTVDKKSKFYGPFPSAEAAKTFLSKRGWDTEHVVDSGTWGYVKHSCIVVPIANENYLHEPAKTPR